MKQTGDVTCLYDASAAVSGKSVEQMRLGVMEVMKEKPYIIAPMIHARNYLDSIGAGSGQTLRGGYDPMTSYATNMMVEQYVSQKNDVELKQFGDTMLQAYKKYCVEGVTTFALGGVELLKVSGNLLSKTKIGQAVISKGGDYITKISAKIANQNKLFINAAKSGVEKLIPSKLSKASKEIEKYLGKNPKFIKTNKGNITIMSKDCKRQVRFDFEVKDDKPHFHLKKLKNNGKFGDAIKNIHRIYFKK
jgi:hypothetical protein